MKNQKRTPQSRREFEFVNSAIAFLESKEKFKHVSGYYEKIFSDFKLEAQVFFNKLNENSENEKDSVEFELQEDSIRPGKITINRVKRTSVIFDAEKLEKILSKEYRSKVIEKKYEISDMLGLINFLKSYKVDPKIFREFLMISKSVNVGELDKLEELGYIKVKDLRGCYEIKEGSEYFTVKVKEDGLSGGKDDDCK